MPAEHPQRLSRSPSWWERSIVKRSTYAIDNLVETMMGESTFLQRQEEEESSSSVLQLDRSQVQVGAMLGKGSFSVVSEVTGLNLDQSTAAAFSAQTGEDQQQDTDLCLSSVLSHLVEEQEEEMPHSHKRQYAIKHLRPDLIPKSGDPEHFQAAASDLIMEAKYLSSLNHPGILKLRAVAQGGSAAFLTNGGDYDGFFIITDRLQGTLKDKILEWQCLQQEESLLECLHMAAHDHSPSSSAAPRTWEEECKEDNLTALTCSTNNPRRLLLEKLDLALQLARALQYMHERRLIYRDLKPQNIGVTDDNTVQLFDFGFTRELPPCNFMSYDDEELAATEEDDDDLLYFMSGKGSLMYLAPEVLYNGRYNRKADCYSFAMVFYELLTLNKPFTSVTNQQIFRELIVRHKARPSLELAEIPASVQDLLRNAWNNTVSQRWTMKQICERLEDIIIEETQQLDRHGMEVSEEELEEHIITPATSPLCGGEMVDLVLDFARDVRLGFQILTGQDKTLSLRSGPMEALFEEEDEEDSLVDMLNDMLAAPQEEDNVVPTIERQGTDLSNATMATEEPLEVTLEEAFSTSADHSHKENQPSAEEDQRIDEHSSYKVSEERCPPSPPLERTTSAPAAPNGKSRVLGDIQVLQVPYGLPPRHHHQSATMKPSRRQSYHGNGLLPTPPPPERPRRRQSYNGDMFSDDGPQWISSVPAF